MKTKTVKLTEPQLEMAIYELEQSLRGDNDSYEKRLTALINKLKDAKGGE